MHKIQVVTPNFLLKRKLIVQLRYGTQTHEPLATLWTTQIPLISLKLNTLIYLLPFFFPATTLKAALVSGLASLTAC